jgi:hypothetical protein
MESNINYAIIDVSLVHGIINYHNIFNLLIIILRSFTILNRDTCHIK